MTRRTSLLLSIMLLACYSALATDRTLAAEGDYVSQQYPKRPAHWKLWHLRDGTYEVEETLLRGNVVQVFRFDSQFLPTGFSLTIDPDKARSKVLPQKPPFTPRTMISIQTTYYRNMSTPRINDQLHSLTTVVQVAICDDREVIPHVLPSRNSLDSSSGVWRLPVRRPRNPVVQQRHHLWSSDRSRNRFSSRQHVC